MSYGIFNKIGDGTAGWRFLVNGTIIIFHIDHDVYKNGKINLEKLQVVDRIAGNGYVRTIYTFDIIRKIAPDQ